MRKSTRIYKRRRKMDEYVSRKYAVRNHCLECMGYYEAEVRGCTAPECWLYPYRLGAFAEDIEIF